MATTTECVNEDYLSTASARKFTADTRLIGVAAPTAGAAMTPTNGEVHEVQRYLQRRLSRR